MSKVVMTDEEIVSSLKHSQLPTIIVEGPDDTMIYRWMLEDFEIGQACLLPCGGRDTLLNVYNRQNEFSHIPVLFIADKDTFVYSGVPHNYSKITFTQGYSIENDLYQGRKIEQLLSKSEKKNFCKALQNFIRYYGCMLDRFTNGHTDYSFREHPAKILTDSYDLSVNDIPGVFVEPNAATVQYLTNNYDLLLRGHSLFQILLMFLSPQHKKRTVKYSKNQLYDICYRQHKSNAIKNMHSVIMNFCNASGIDMKK
jgi:hypothetical protein